MSSVPPLSDEARVVLEAGDLIGVNTVGANLRNAGWVLRSESPHPHVEVAPWPEPPEMPHINPAVEVAPWPDPPRSPPTPLAEPAEEESVPTESSPMPTRVPRLAHTPPRAPRIERMNAMSARPRVEEEADDTWSRLPPPPLLDPAPAPRPSRVIYTADDLPKVYARALEMQGGGAPWDYESARRALENAIDAESVPGGRYLPVLFTYPRFDGGQNFRMLLMSEESIVPGADGNGTHANHTGVARLVGEYGIDQELALRYLTYDYLSHRSRQEGIGLRATIGTEGFSARGRIAEEHRAVYLDGLFEAYDAVLSNLVK